MADNVTVGNETGQPNDYTVASDEVSGAQHQLVKVEWGSDGSATQVAAGASALPIQDGGNAITVDGSVTVSGTVDLGATDNAVLDDIAASADAIETAVEGTLTVQGTVTANLSATDNAVLDNIDTDLTTIIGHVDGLEALLTTIDSDTSNLAVVGGGTEAAAIRVTIANNSTGVLSVDDNGSTLSIDDGGGVITVDGTVSVTGVATAANQTTIIGHVDGIEALLTTIDADTSALVAGITISALPNEGQQTMADSISVAIASNQSAVSVTDTNGAAALTALQLIDDTVFIDDADFTDGTSKGIGVMAVAENTPTTVTDGDMGMLAIVPSTRELKVLASLSSTDNTVLDNINTNTGLLAGALAAEDTGASSGDIGYPMLGVRTPGDTTETSDDGDYGMVSLTAEGGVWVEPLHAVRVTAGTHDDTQGTGVAIFLDLDENAEDVGDIPIVAATNPLTIQGYHFYNNASSPRFVKLYDEEAANITVGTDEPKFIIALPAEAAGHITLSPAGWPFNTACCVAATTDREDDGSPGAPSTNDVLLELWFTG